MNDHAISPSHTIPPGGAQAETAASLRGRIDDMLTGFIADSLRAVECRELPDGTTDVAIGTAAVADIQVTHVLGLPDAAYRIAAFEDDLLMRVQLNVYRLVVLYSLPLRQVLNVEGLEPQFARWQIGAGHAGWTIGWRDKAQAGSQDRTAEIFCYAMLPEDFLWSPQHQLYWVNDLVQMTQSLFLEAHRLGLRLSL